MLRTLLKAAALALCIAATPTLAQTQAEAPATTAPTEQVIATGAGSTAFARYHFRRWRFYRHHHHRHHRRWWFFRHHHYHHWRWYFRHYRHHFHRFHFHHHHWRWHFRGRHFY